MFLKVPIKSRRICTDKRPTFPAVQVFRSISLHFVSNKNKANPESYTQKTCASANVQSKPTPDFAQPDLISDNRIMYGRRNALF